MATTTVGRLRSRRPFRISIAQIIVFVILFIGLILMIFPFIWMILSAFKTAEEVSAYPPVWLPRQPTLHLLRRVWTEINFKLYFANSIFTTVTSTAAVLLTSTFVGYVLAKYEFRGRQLLFLSLVATMMIPWPVLLIPQYLIALRLHMVNSYWAIIAPSLYSAYSIFMVRQFMHSIPNELLDAARIDGSSEPGIFFRIVLPLVKPVIATLGIINFMGNWDSFLWPLIVLSSEKLYTLPLGLAMFTNKYYTDYAAVNAGAMVATVPVLIVFLVFQRYFIEGIAMTGLKA